MSIGANISVITVGAVLAFATRVHDGGVVSVRAVGGVLILVGLASLALKILSLRGGAARQPYIPYNETTATPLRPGEGVAYNLPNNTESE